jgi:hypothetical protein
VGDLRCAQVGRQPVSPFPTQLAPDRPMSRILDYESSGLRVVTDIRPWLWHVRRAGAPTTTAPMIVRSPLLEHARRDNGEDENHERGQPKHQ